MISQCLSCFWAHVFWLLFGNGMTSLHRSAQFKPKQARNTDGFSRIACGSLLPIFRVFPVEQIHVSKGCFGSTCDLLISFSTMCGCFSVTVALGRLRGKVCSFFVGLQSKHSYELQRGVVKQIQKEEQQQAHAQPFWCSVLVDDVCLSSFVIEMLKEYVYTSQYIFN